MAEAVDNWDAISDWWRREATTDLVYREDVQPMLERLLPSRPGRTIDLGCGEGQWLRWLAGAGVEVVGCDRSMGLLSNAVDTAPVVCARLPELAWARDGSFDTAISLFVLDLLEDAASFFSEIGRVVGEGGSLVVVINHPGFTAPGSGPLLDLDGEVLWRWGSYLEEGSSLVPAGEAEVAFHHRPLGRLLSTAAASGWSLEELEEAPLGQGAIERDPGYEGQEGIPRFLGARWRRSSRISAMGR